MSYHLGKKGVPPPPGPGNNDHWAGWAQRDRPTAPPSGPPSGEIGIGSILVAIGIAAALGIAVHFHWIRNPTGDESNSGYPAAVPANPAGDVSSPAR